MGPKHVIRYLLGTNDYVLNAMLNDLGDADLLVRSVPGANHIAWQLGHLIETEQSMLKSVPGAQGIDLPPDWAGAHTAEASQIDPPRGFGKSQYLDVYKRSRDNVRRIVDALPDADLDKPVEGPLAQICPKIGDLLTLIADHPMMHVGQFAVVRRKLGKPRVI